MIISYSDRSGKERTAMVTFAESADTNGILVTITETRGKKPIPKEVSVIIPKAEMNQLLPFLKAWCQT